MLEIVSSILRAYKSDHGFGPNGLRDTPPIRTSLLRPYVQERGIVDKISIEEVDIETRFIVAQVQKFIAETGPYEGVENHATIYYAKNQNYCWRRFGVCKELYHCMTDRLMTDRVATTDSLVTLLELIISDSTSVTGEYPPFDKEQQAEFMALETLFPVEYRELHYRDIRNQGLSYMDIADRFKIPLIYAKMAYQEHYHEKAKALRGKLIEMD